MSALSQPPPWAYQVCHGCGAKVILQVHDLTCYQFDHRTRVAVAWICDSCDHVLDTVGLFASWSAALFARHHELDLRSARYLVDQPGFTELRQIVPAQFRRRGPE